MVTHVTSKVLFGGWGRSPLECLQCVQKDALWNVLKTVLFTVSLEESSVLCYIRHVEFEGILAFSGDYTFPPIRLTLK